MMLLLEGPDGAGKGVLAERLCARFGAEYVHVSSPKPGDDVFEHHFAPIRGLKSPAVVDRLHVSDDAYGHVLRGGPGLTDQEFGFIDGFLSERSTVMILCQPALATVLSNVRKAAGKENHEPETAEAVWREFRTRRFRTKLPFLTYNYQTDYSADKLINRLEIWADGGCLIKLCSSCRDRFTFGGKAGRPYCRVCAAVYTARIRAQCKMPAGKDTAKRSVQQRWAMLRGRYGIGEVEYMALIEKQAGACAICRDTNVVLCVDHDHSTSIVRGLLCGSCNRGIGLIGGKPDTLKSAIKYLEGGPSC